MNQSINQVALSAEASGATRRLAMRLWAWGLTAGLAAGLSACVTINIYFPAAAAEKAADKVIDEIWQIPANRGPASSQSNDAPANPTSTTPGAQPSPSQEGTP